MLPLSGTRIIAIEQYGAGPFGTMLLADLGAEIIKVENPADGGDVSRQVGPHFGEDGESLFFHTFNRNKRSLTLNLKKPAARAVLYDLARSADGLINNLRGDQPGRLGLTYADLRHINPRLVCAHLSAYGRSGSRKSWPGYDYLMQAEAGYLSLTGEPNGPPARCGLSLVDYMTGVVASMALLAGILGARATGQGRDLDVSLFDVALHNLSYLATWHLNAGVKPTRVPRSAHPSLTPSQLYRTKDGWIFIMCNKEKFWPILAARIGTPELADDPDFCTFKQRLTNRDKLTAVLDQALSERTTSDWIEVLGGSVPVAPVYDIAQALATPFVKRQRRVAEFGTKGVCNLRMLAGPIRLNDEVVPTKQGPAVGADTNDVLKDLGYSDERLNGLRQEEVI
jgi:crotonobetainyl-CoA:carnitine CoA-transferase CaiB-like acyl-CoA transferase